MDLEVRILNELWVHFSEVRILEGLAEAEGCERVSRADKGVVPISSAPKNNSL
jgi:hypothetical protein